MTSVRLPSSIAVVGAGKLGTVLTSALREKAIADQVIGPVPRGELPSAELVLLCVPDQQLSTAAAACAGRSSQIGHLSGATPLSALSGAGVPALGMHPLQTFRLGDSPARFQDVGCATGGTTDEAQRLADQLAQALGMKPFPIADEQRPAYHAAACLASNYLLTLLEGTERLAAVVGLDRHTTRALFAPLVTATVENWGRTGPAASLTGPVARDDHATLSAHREAIRQHTPELAELVDQLVADTAALVRRSPERGDQ